LNPDIINIKNWRIFNAGSLALGVIAFAWSLHLYSIHPDSDLMGILWIPVYFYFVADWTAYLLLIAASICFYLNRKTSFHLYMLYLASSVYHLLSSLFDGFNPVIYHEDKILLVLMIQLVSTTYVIIKENSLQFFGITKTPGVKRWLLMFAFYPLLWLILSLVSPLV